jgi:Flp pilus assembly CpaE family ATPase
VLIDVPSYRATDYDEILKHSDFIFLTSLYSVPSVRRCHRLVQRIDGLKVARDRRAIVINDAETNIIGTVMKRFDVETALRGERVCFVRRDRSFALECADAGFSMMQTDPKRGICKDMAKLGELIETLRPAIAA